MSIDTSIRPDVEDDSVVAHWSDLELCEALYWLRRARRRDDAAMTAIWTDRLNSLLDWRLEHGTDPMP
jgi:hypothetical protein